MRTGALASAALLAHLVWTGTARAEALGTPLSLYAAGEYSAAAELAQQDSGSAASLAFAARALLAACVIERQGDGALLRAEQAARAALALDPNSVEARLQLAVVLGMRGRRASIAEAFARGYAAQGRRLIDEALALAPNSAEAAALLGVWHLEIIRRGGSAGAMLYGAREAEGIAAFERARALEPNSVAIALQYALALAEVDADRHQDRISQLLIAAHEIAPHDALESYSQSVANRLAAALAESGPRGLTRMANALRR